MCKRRAGAPARGEKYASNTREKDKQKKEAKTLSSSSSGEDGGGHAREMKGRARVTSVCTYSQRKNEYIFALQSVFSCL